MSPVPYTWGPFLAKIFLKIWFCKIDPLLPPHIDFNTIPYFTYGYPYRGVKEGELKKNFFFSQVFLRPAHYTLGTLLRPKSKKKKKKKKTKKCKKKCKNRVF